MGEYFKGRLEFLRQKYSFIKHVKGMGLMLGIVLDREGSEFVSACMERGFLVNCIQQRILRFIPPLIVGKKEIDLLIDCLDDIFSAV